MLASLAATAVAGTIRLGAVPSGGSTGAGLGALVVARIRDALLGLHQQGTDIAPDAMGDSLAEAEAHFAACRYTELADGMPRLILAGQTHGADETASATIAQIYTLATRILIKLDDQQVAWMAADRARAYASAGAPLAAGEASRWLAVLARKAGAYPQATSIALDAADDPDLRGDHPDLLRACRSARGHPACLLRAEHLAPQEIHARPAIRDLVSGLLVSGRTDPLLRGLAARCGIS